MSEQKVHKTCGEYLRFACHIPVKSIVAAYDRNGNDVYQRFRDCLNAKMEYRTVQYGSSRDPRLYHIPSNGFTWSFDRLYTKDRVYIRTSCDVCGYWVSAPLDHTTIKKEKE